MIDHDQIVSDIRTSAEEVFSTMLGTELHFTESYCDKGPSHPLDGVICLIGMAGQWAGTGTISCSAEFACRIASLMLMAEYTLVDADVLDAVAEIANMVLGNVKTALEVSLGTMGMSIPTAIFGKNFMAKSYGDETWTVVVFDCEGQRLEVKLFLKRTAGSPAPGAAKAGSPIYMPA
ncbi:MAG: chemotaxis protein CheX [Bryobacteraceae bacterium]|jgi:chemotaxis protein CheX